MGPTRRELLTLLLGAPLAATTCRRPAPASVAGRVRGAALEVGHRLRDETVPAPSGADEHVEVAIVGAGPSGLSAAWYLRHHGVRDLLVFDLEAAPGGTSTHGTDGVVPYPWAAHYLPLPTRENAELVSLLAEMGIVDVAPDGSPRPRPKMLLREPAERVFYDGAWHEGLLPSGLASARDRVELERFQRRVDAWVAWRDASGRRAFALPRRRSTSAGEVRELDRISAAEWLDREGMRAPLVRWYLEYACRDDYGCTLATTSAWALHFYFAARVAQPGAPSAPFLVWPEGNGRLVRHLAGPLGSQLRLGHLVSEVVPEHQHVRLAVFDVARGITRWVRAKHVILAVPRFVAGHLLRPWRHRAPSFLDAFTYGVWATANLHLWRRPRSSGFPFAWDNVIHGSPSLGYVVATHQTLRDQGPTVWTYYLPMVDPDPLQARRRLEAQDHASFCDAILGDLGRAHEDLEECLERVDVWRWGHAMIRPTVGFLWGQAREQAAAPVGHVHFAHSDLSGLALFEEAFDQGLRAAQEVVARRAIR